MKRREPYLKFGGENCMIEPHIAMLILQYDPS